MFKALLLSLSLFTMPVLAAECITYEDLKKITVENNIPTEDLITLDGVEVSQAFVIGVTSRLGPPPVDLSKADKVLIVKIGEQAIVAFLEKDCRILTAQLYTSTINMILKEAKID